MVLSFIRVCSTIILIFELSDTARTAPVKTIDSIDANVGETFSLVCPVDPKEKQVDWSYNSPFSRRGSEITVSGIVVDEFRKEFATGTNRRGHKTLTISSVQLHNAGLYHCASNNGLGQPHYIHLSVIDVDSYQTMKTAEELVPITDRLTTVNDEPSEDEEHKFNPKCVQTIVLAVIFTIALTAATAIVVSVFVLKKAGSVKNIPKDLCLVEQCTADGQ